jgi:putative ABC transport system permease protein
VNGVSQWAVGWQLAIAYLRARPVATVLNVLMLSLGVATIVSLLLIARQLENKSERDSAGIDLVVGAKGSPLQLVLSSVYHLDVPTGNISQDAARLIAAMPAIKRAVPIALGDSFRRFRIVGTNAEFFELYGLKLHAGRLPDQPLQAAIGSTVAAEAKLTLGARFAGNHGLSEGAGAHEEHRFEVTGILAPTGGVTDRLILTPLESVWELHHHQPRSDAHEEAHEITALLIQYASPLAAARLPREINAISALQAAAPAAEMARLFGFLGIGIEALKGFAALVMFLAAAGIFVALTGLMADRQADIALLRVLGASRRVVFAALAVQGGLTGLLGAILGLVLAHLAVAAFAAWFAGPQGLFIETWMWVDGEAWAFAAALLLALLASWFPAWRAYREAATAALSRN